MSLEKILDELIDALSPDIRKKFLEVIQSISDEAILKDMIAAIEIGDAEGAFRAAGFDEQSFYPVIKAINEAYEQGAFTTADTFPSRLELPDGTKFMFRFNMRNPRVEEYLKNHSSQLVTRLTNEARTVVQTTLERGMIAGDNPRTTALNIVGRIDPVTKKRVGGVIGLTANQENWSANVKRDLNNLDRKYFTRNLRDKRFDSIVEKAIKSGKPLDQETISKLVTSYNNRALKFRADNIARTETIQAINKAEWEAHKQVVETGAVSQNAVKRYWDSAGDSRVRWSHEIMDRKYAKEGVGIDEPFVSPSGARMMHPGDTSLGASGDETIMCRCRVKMKVDWFDNL